MTLSDHIKASFVRTGLIQDDHDADLHVARFEGHATSKMGVSTVVSFAAWLRAQTPEGADRYAFSESLFHDDARMSAYADLLASRASGAVVTPVDYGDQGAFPVVRDPMPPRYDADGLDYRFDQFAESAGRLMFAAAWANRMDENGEGASLSGTNVYEEAPETPREAVLEGAVVGGMYEQGSGKGVWDLYVDALRAEFGSDVDPDDHSETRAHGFEHFANDLAFEAEGAGVRWDDDHASFDHPRLRYEYCCDAGLPSMEGEDQDEDPEAAPSP